MAHFSQKYDEGKSNNSSNSFSSHRNGPMEIGSDLDMSDGSDMDLEDDESFASSLRRSQGSHGSHGSYGSHGSAAGSIARGSGGRNTGFGGSNNHTTTTNNNNHGNNHGTNLNHNSTAGEAKMSPPPARNPTSHGGGYGAVKPTRNTKRLSLAIGESTEFGGGEAPSYDVTESVFIKGDLAINRTGVRMAHRNKTFVVDASELQLGKIIGRGSSSYVQHAQHTPTGTQVALKVINMFDKGKRDQLMQEITTLYDAACPSIVGFYGAFYRDGTISIALEFMDGGR